MQKSPKPTSQESFGVQDILYILFKHKWKILFFSILGFIASAYVFVNREVLYQSQSNILVSYVLNPGTVENYQGPPGGPGDQVITTEVEIITSEDLARKVAEAVGIEKVLPVGSEGATVVDAAGMILAHTEVVVSPGSNVIHISYSSPKPEYAVLILEELVKQYSIKHLELHRDALTYDDVSKQVEEVRLRLKQTESELDKLRTESGISTLAGATAALENQRARTKEDLMAAKAELAEKINVKEQQIQRYEATNYETASLARIDEIIYALKITTRINVVGLCPTTFKVPEGTDLQEIEKEQHRVSNRRTLIFN